MLWMRWSAFGFVRRRCRCGFQRTCIPAAADVFTLLAFRLMQLVVFPSYCLGNGFPMIHNCPRAVARKCAAEIVLGVERTAGPSICVVSIFGKDDRLGVPLTLGFHNFKRRGADGFSRDLSFETGFREHLFGGRLQNSDL